MPREQRAEAVFRTCPSLGPRDFREEVDFAQWKALVAEELGKTGRCYEEHELQDLCQHMMRNNLIIVHDVEWRNRHMSPETVKEARRLVGVYGEEQSE